MRIKRVRESTWQVLALCAFRGDCPLLDFLTGLEGNLQRDGRRVLQLLERVSQYGPPRNTDICHQVGDGIWEFIQGRIRILWFYDKGKMILCTHGFVKKSQKTPRADLEQALRQRRAYELAASQGHIRIED